jgi:hypothetical protein
MKISSKPPPALIIIDRKMEQVEHFNHLGSTITNDAGSTREITSTIATVKAAFNKKVFFWYQQIGIELQKETGTLIHLVHSFVRC